MRLENKLSEEINKGRNKQKSKYAYKRRQNNIIQIKRYNMIIKVKQKCQTWSFVGKRRHALMVEGCTKLDVTTDAPQSVCDEDIDTTLVVFTPICGHSGYHKKDESDSHQGERNNSPFRFHDQS